MFSLDSIGPVIRSLTNIVLTTDSLKQIYINPDGRGGLSIGTYDTNPNAVATISADNQGILLPRLTQDSINAIVTGIADDGLLVFNATTKAFNVFADGSWQEISTMSGVGLWTENGSGEAFRLSNVGIGNTNPAAQLDVEDDVVIRGDRLDFKPPNGGTFNWFSIVKDGLDFVIAQQTNGGNLSLRTDKDLYFETDNGGLDTTMTILRNGNVGIGTEAPESALHVEGSNTGGLGLRLSRDGSTVDFDIYAHNANAGVGTVSNHPLRFFTNNSFRMEIGDNGNIGIGVPQADQKLEVDGAVQVGSTTTPTEGTIQYNSATDDFEGYDGTMWKSMTAAGTSSPWSNNLQDLYFDTGNVAVGTNTPESALHVEGSSGGGLGLRLTRAGSSVDFDLYAHNANAGIGTVSNHPLRFFTSNSFSMEINNDGNVGIGVTQADQKLEVDGAVQIGSTATPTEGTIQYNDVTDDFEGYDGSAWQSLTATGGASLWNKNGDFINYGSTFIEDIDVPSGSFPNISNTENTKITLRREVTGNTNPLSNGSFDVINLSSAESKITLNQITFPQITTETISLDGSTGQIQSRGLDVVNGGDITITAAGTTTIELDGQTGNVEANEVNLGATNASSKLEVVGDGSYVETVDITSTANKTSGQDLLNLTVGSGSADDAQILECNGVGGRVFQINANGDTHVGGSNGPISFIPNYQGTNDARIITDELQIDGGSDFAEHFDIVEEESLDPLPGMVVSIDPASTGKLEITKSAYDRKVAGIISGANGVETGLMMGQRGSIADGDYPVALSGRVYVYANMEGGKIQPGDLLTTSSTAGYAMKVQDYGKAQGAIIGKAMTTIDKNGFVLVLVNLQ